MKLTEPQLRALRILAERKRTPSELGYAMNETAAKPSRYMRAQGAGRLGGTMAARLQRMGLAINASSERDGWPLWRISSAGVDAIRAAGKEG